MEGGREGGKEGGGRIRRCEVLWEKLAGGREGEYEDVRCYEKNWHMQNRIHARMIIFMLDNKILNALDHFVTNKYVQSEAL